MYKLFAWGANHYSQCGMVSPPQKISVPTQIDSNNYLKVAVGYNHCLAIDENHHLYGWGKNSHYQVLNSPDRIIQIPTLIDDTRSYIDISCGLNHSVAIDNSNNLYMWGHNFHDTKVPYIKDLLLIASDIIKISCGLSFILFLTNTNNLYFLGSIHFSQYGFPGRKTHVAGNIGNFELFLHREPYFLAENITNMWGSSNYLFCKKTNDKLYTLGYNHQGNLGLGFGFSKQTKELVELPIIPKNISTKGMFTYLQTESNQLYTTGNNFFNQLGHNDTQYLSEFTLNPSSFVNDDISCGCTHGFIKSHNSYYGRGSNRFGEIIDLDVPTINTFTDVGVFDKLHCGLNFNIGLRT